MIKRIPAPAAIFILTIFLTTCAYAATESQNAPDQATPIPASINLPPLKIMNVNRKFNFVTINEGLQDGLKVGDFLKVFKQGQENATIRIEKLYNRLSLATIIEEDPKRQIVEGDEILKV